MPAIDMITPRGWTRRRRPHPASATCWQRPVKDEAGFVLISVLFLVAMILLVLAVAAPRVAEDIRRDRESEFYHRGLQYRRAIKLYVRKTGHYPTSLDQLENTNDIRFLRRRYKDPITGKDEWRLIHLGEAKVPPMGLFGQPLTAGVPAAAVGSNIGDAGTAQGGSGGVGGSPAVGASDGPGAGGVGPGGLAPGAPGTSGSIPTDGSTSGSGPGSATNSTAGGGSTGFIVGVSSNSTRESIRAYKLQTHYNQWEFVYNPQEDRGGTGLAPTAPGGTGAGSGGGPNAPAPGPGPAPPPPPVSGLPPGVTSP